MARTLKPLIQRGAAEDAAALTALALRSKAHWGYPQEWLAIWKPELTLSPADIDGMHVQVALYCSLSNNKRRPLLDRSVRNEQLPSRCTRSHKRPFLATFSVDRNL